MPDTVGRCMTGVKRAPNQPGVNCDVRQGSPCHHAWTVCPAFCLLLTPCPPSAFTLPPPAPAPLSVQVSTSRVPLVLVFLCTLFVPPTYLSWVLADLLKQGLAGPPPFPCEEPVNSPVKVPSKNRAQD